MKYLPVISEWLAWSGRLLINHLWQATLFSVLALTATLLLKRAPARARYLIWLAAAVKFALPSALIFMLLSGVGIDLQPVFKSSSKTTPALQYIGPIVSPIVVPKDYLAGVPDLTAAGKAAARTVDAPKSSSLSLLILPVWLTGCLVLFYSWFKRRRQLTAAIRAGRRQVIGREREALTTVMAWLGIRRHVELVITPAVKEPGVWGMMRPIVLLPEEISAQLTDEELESLMMHEMAHVLRWDNLVSNLNMVLCCLFWFNPIVWLIDRCLLKEREEACDEVVIRWSGTGEVYASSITKIYRFCLNSRLSGLSAAGGSSLKRRLERIIDNNPAQRLRMTHKILVISVAFICLMLSLIAGPATEETVVARTNAAWQQVAAGITQQTQIPVAKTCTEPEPGKCLPLATTITQGQLAQVTVRPDPAGPIEARQVVPAPSTATATITQRPEATKDEPPPPPFESAHAFDLKKFVGRYGVNPGVMENFIFDVSLRDGELWLQPSHTARRRMFPVSNLEYVDSKSSNTRITFNFDSTGNVDSFTLRGWGPTIVALRLVLPPPSLAGNVTFKLAGFADARVVAVAGSFNNWNQSQYLFSKVGDEWIARVNLPPGKYQYKFIVDGTWLVDPTNPTIIHDERDFENSVLIVK